MSGAGNIPQAAERRFLFLQGPLSPLYRDIGRILRRQGCSVFRINLCFGDWLHWHEGDTLSYRGDLADWEGFVGAVMDREGITDLVLHGDQRFYHKQAIAQARRRGVRVFVTELGFLRSGWMTLEREGLATLSRFPVDPRQIISISERSGPIDFSPAFPKSTWREIVPDVIYNLGNALSQPFFPHYQRHTIYHPVPEYLRGGWRLLWEGKRMRLAGKQIEILLASGHPYFILPLQLEGDFQLRAHSPYRSFGEVMAVVLESFAKNADADACLVLKTHPLDVGLENWPAVAQSLAQHYDIEGRVIFLDGGSLSDLFDGASGLVTLNSTAGLEALQANVPVKTLVPAHYDIEGLTFSGSLSDFWRKAGGPDAELLGHYVRAVAATLQVRGSIHNREGTVAAAQNIAKRMIDLSVNEPDAFGPEPPRLAKARSLGVPL
ncbi:capsule biosynthesis protein [Roseibium sp.]|uniref:capsule biosynthesis protein n=1 Tax=Roseibium sp. TaxID=1936156 RepID=UPI003A96BC64